MILEPFDDPSIDLSSLTDGIAARRRHPASINDTAAMETPCMRFLFTTIPGSGHFHPLVPTARALRGRGHDVAFAASPTFGPAIEAAGFEAYPAGPAWLEHLSDPVMQKILAGEFFVDLIRMGMVEGVIRAAKAAEADAIVHGGAELGGLVAGAILDLPVATAATGGTKMFWPLMRPGIVRAAAEHGLDGERVAADDYEVLMIDRTPASLESPGYQSPPTAVNVRPEPFDDRGELPGWFDELGKRPLVYVTLGTVMNGNVPLFRLIADALADLPYDVVIALGSGVSPDALGQVAGNIQVGGYLPQTRIIERASAVVCHGGYNTVAAALSAGVPLFLLPMGADQPFNTERCITAGAALGVIQPQPPGPPSAAPPPFLPPDPAIVRDGTRRILEEPSFRQRARAIAAEIAAMPPAAYAAEHLEIAVGERQRSRRAGRGSPVSA
jgi:UDP:flavonoid glycosyltransferase YjiC (YdhE family)